MNGRGAARGGRLAGALGVLSLAIVFVLSVVLGALLHLNLRAAKRVVRGAVNGALGSLPSAQVHVGEIERLGPRGADVRTLEVDVPGVGHVRAEHLRVEANPFLAAWDLVRRRDVVRISVSKAEVAQVDWELVPPKKAASPSEPRAGETKSRGIDLDVGALVVSHANVHGLAAGQVVDVDLDRLRASGGVAPLGVHAVVSTAAKVSRVLEQPVYLDIDASGSAPLGAPSGKKPVGRARITARAGEAVLLVVAAATGEKVDVEADLPETSAEALHALWPKLPLAAPVSARVRLEGELPLLDVHLEAELGKGTVRADGQTALDAGPSLWLSVVARDLDLATVSGSLPRTRIGFDADLQLRNRMSLSGTFPVDGEAKVRTLPSVVSGIDVPRIEGTVNVEPTQFLVVATAHEPGVPVHFELRGDPRGRLEVSVDATMRSLADVKRFTDHGLILGGRAIARADGALAGGVLTSRATVDVFGMEMGKVAIGAAHIEASANGVLDELVFRLFGHVIALRVAPFSLTDISISAHGTKAAVDLSVSGRGGSLEVLALAAHLEPGARSRILDLSARLDNAGESLTLTTPEIAFTGDSADVTDLRIDGLGSPVMGTLHLSPNALVARLAAPFVDLTRVERLSGSSVHLRGTGSIEAELDLRQPTSSANGHLRVLGGAVGSMPECNVDLSFDLHGANANAALVVRSERLGGARLSAHADLGASPALAKALRESTGTLALTTDRIPIDRLCSDLGCGGFLGRLAAKLAGTTTAVRVDVSRRPAALGEADTNIRLSADASDDLGQLVSVAVDSRLDIRRAFANRAFPNDAPIEAQFEMARRTLDQLPKGFDTAALAGAVRVHGYARGTVAKPFIVLEAVAEGLHYVGLPQRSQATLDVRWITTYDLSQATSEIDVQSGRDHVVRASLRLDASLEQLLARGASWRGDLDVEIHRFPLSFVPALADRGVRGSLSGRLGASGIHEQPELHGELAVDDLHVDRDVVGPVTLSLEASDHNCIASLEAGGQNVASNQHGHAQMRVRAACQWKSNAIPEIDRAAPLELALDAERFPLAALQPLAENAIERLRGTIDAHLHVSGPPDPLALLWGAQGEVRLRGGNMLPLVFGREIRRIDAEISADGTGVLRAVRLSGEMGAGSFTGTALFRFHEARLEHAEAEIHVPHGSPIPFTLQGVSYGTLWGDVFAKGDLKGSQFMIDVRAPTLRGELPPQRSGGLESLDDNPAVVVVQPLEPPEERVATGGGPGEKPPTSISVVLGIELGNDVSISREDMKLEVSTAPSPQNPKITFDHPLTVDGTIRIRSGRVPVAGRVFRVDRGVVRFGGDDPSDPSLDVDAIYEGTDASGTRISVHVGGTAKDVKLTLTSSPPKSESELLAILAFGEPVPSTITGGPSTETGVASSMGPTMAPSSAAVGVGTAVLTSGINQMLSQSVIPIRTGVSTGQQTQASASVQVSERLRVEYIRQFGATLYGQPQDVNRFAVDWRFKPRWMLRTVVGDRGTTNIDVLWQRWY